MASAWTFWAPTATSFRQGHPSRPAEPRTADTRCASHRPHRSRPRYRRQPAGVRWDGVHFPVGSDDHGSMDSIIGRLASCSADAFDQSERPLDLAARQTQVSGQLAERRFRRAPPRDGDASYVTRQAAQFAAPVKSLRCRPAGGARGDARRRLAFSALTTRLSCPATDRPISRDSISSGTADRPAGVAARRCPRRSSRSAPRGRGDAGAGRKPLAASH